MPVKRRRRILPRRKRGLKDAGQAILDMNPVYRIGEAIGNAIEKDIQARKKRNHFAALHAKKMKRVTANPDWFDKIGDNYIEKNPEIIQGVEYAKKYQRLTDKEKANLHNNTQVDREKKLRGWANVEKNLRKKYFYKGMPSSSRSTALKKISDAKKQYFRGSAMAFRDRVIRRKSGYKKKKRRRTKAGRKRGITRFRQNGFRLKRGKRKGIVGAIASAAVGKILNELFK